MQQTSLRQLLKERGLTMARLAAAFDIEKSSVLYWARKRVPAERVLDVERITGIPRHQLRPDIYPAPYEEEAA